MELKGIKQNRIDLTFSPDELSTICNMFLETLEALEEWEFDIRTGVKREEAKKMHTDLLKIMRMYRSRDSDADDHR